MKPILLLLLLAVAALGATNEAWWMTNLSPYTVWYTNQSKRVQFVTIETQTATNVFAWDNSIGSAGCVCFDVNSGRWIGANPERHEASNVVETTTYLFYYQGIEVETNVVKLISGTTNRFVLGWQKEKQ